MNLTRDYCNIQRTNTTGSYIKFPTLTELHNKLFDETPENMHNSLMDILICLKCYLKFKHNIAIPEPYYKNILQEIQHEICWKLWNIKPINSKKLNPYFFVLKYAFYICKYVTYIGVLYIRCWICWMGYLWNITLRIWKVQ